MKRVLTTLFFGLAVLAHAQSVTLAWTASTSPDVCNYRVYYGMSSRNYSVVTNCGFVLTQTVGLPHTGRWFFAVTALDADGLESDFSNEAEWEAKPAPPFLHGETWVRLTPVIECSTNLLEWRSVAGVPTWFPATNSQEFFATRQLLIERVQRVEEK